MSWFFGKKKHHRDSPPSSPEEEQPPASQGDEFIFIEKRGNQLPAAPGIREGFGPPGAGLYPNISGMPPYPTTIPADSSKHNTPADVPHLLHGVPFKLCKQLISGTEDDADIDRLRVSEILSFITRLEEEDIDYDFSVERSCIDAMNSANQ